MPATSSADVVVAGLGALGAAAARALARRGLRVVGLDLRQPPHDRGSSHGGTRIIRRVYPEGVLYGPLLARAYAGWRELAEERGEPLRVPAGGLFIGRPGSALVAGALACAGELGLAHERLTAAALGRRFPALRLPPGVEAVWDPEAGVLRLERCLGALLASAAAAGAELRFGAAVDHWSADGAGVQVVTEAGAIAAGRLVLAGGPWLVELAGGGGVELAGIAVERQVQHWFAPAGGRLGPHELPPLVWELAGGATWYALPDLGAGVKAAFHHGGETTTADGVRRAVDRAEVDAVRRLLERHLPAAAGRCRRSAVCLYTNTPDHRFLAGPLARAPRVWILGGGSGHGFKFAPALGELVAGGIAESTTPPELGPFLPDR